MGYDRVGCFAVAGLIGLVVLLAPSCWPKAQELSAPPGAEGAKTELVFTYVREETPKSDVAANITVVTREEMEHMPVNDVAEVLRYIPGVSIESSGGLKSMATASIQGSDSRQVAVYQDGVRLNMLSNPIADLSFLPLQAVERIEVYKGAASSAWGSSLGGVINIITREPDMSKPMGVEMKSSYGSFETYREKGTVTGGAGHFGYLLSLSHEQSDGFMPSWLTRLNRKVPEFLPGLGFEEDNVYAKLNYTFGAASRLSFVYSYDDGRFTDPNFHRRYQAGEPAFFFYADMPHQRAYQRLLYETQLNDEVSLSLEGRHLHMTSSQDIVFDPGGTPHPEWEPSWDYHEQTWGTSGRLSYDNREWNRFLIGFDTDWGKYDWSSYQERFATRAWAVYANDSFNVRDYTFTLGLRYDNNMDFGSEVSPSAGVVYHLPWNKALLRAQVSRGFSAPPSAWVQDPQYGNRDLKAETGMNYQLGAEFSPLSKVRVEVNLFRADIDNLIAFDYNLLRMVNIDQATRQGVEGIIGVNLPHGFDLSVATTFVDVVNEKTEQIVPDIPNILSTVTLSHTYEWLTQSFLARYVDNNSSLLETNDDTVVFDYLVKARLPFPDKRLKISLFAAAYDFTDSKYIVRNRAPFPGRWFEGGMRLEF